MVEGLRSRYAIAKDNNDKNDELSLQIKEIQEHIQELLLEGSLSR